jgi:hypothetical protein
MKTYEYTKRETKIRSDSIFQWIKEVGPDQYSLVSLSLFLHRGVDVEWTRLYYGGKECVYAFTGCNLEELDRQLDMWSSVYLEKEPAQKRTEIIHNTKQWISSLSKNARHTVKEYLPITCYIVKGKGIGNHFWITNIYDYPDDSVRLSLISETGEIITDTHSKLVTKCNCSKWSRNKIPWRGNGYG